MTYESLKIAVSADLEGFNPSTPGKQNPPDRRHDTVMAENSDGSIKIYDRTDGNTAWITAKDPIPLEFER